MLKCSQYLQEVASVPNIQKRIDSHIHYALPLEPETLIDFMDKNGIDKANLVLVPSRTRLTAVPDALMTKAKYPKRFYVFTRLRRYIVVMNIYWKPISYRTPVLFI